MNRESMELSAPYVAASSEAETRMLHCWAEVFDLDRVGLDDDFFELGGDSLLATTMVTSVHAAFGVKLRESQLADLCTPRRLLASFVASNAAGGAKLPANVIAVNPGGKRAPLFMIHGAAGIVFLQPRFRAALDPEQPVYLFQARGYDGTAAPLGSVEKIAADYLRSILEIQPGPPWNLVAYCAGGWIAVELVKQMQRQGLVPRSVVLVDTNLPLGMRKDYSLKRPRIGTLRLPMLPDSAVGLINAGRALTRRIRFFVSTGSFRHVDGSAALDDPAVHRHLVSRMRRRNEKRAASKLKALDASPEQGSPGMDAASMADVYASEAAAVTSASLKLAYRSYAPSPSDYPFTFISSLARSAPFDDPDYPINRLLPNRRVVMSGETHGDAVSSPETAILIQKIVHEGTVAGSDPSTRPSAMIEGQPVAG
ncbi:hypothetical protein EJC49_05460 [Aquibium carbonis]|uniref:Carrier domain-containing protein n=1 Tax=Aquibium carbonis TaxID=2495581 RepID=A0A429Z1B4_9HYPH|nr:thioesterase domain-containing protein [Aquibium carbonis]RST87424.1 hypothetical protein EJC49_05460 [Aquibium carbonis]